MHIGVLGGTFNPIHRCHLHVAKFVRRTCKLSHILFIPTGDPPHKAANSLAPSSHRLKMVQLALKTQPHCKVSDIEIQHQGVSYTVETISTLQDEYPDTTQWSFIIGLDAFLEFHTWKAAPRLLTLCHFIVCSRPGAEFSALRSVDGLPPLPAQRLQDIDQGRTSRVDIPLPSSTKQLTLLSMPPCDVSASLIRTRLREGRPVSHWLPPSIESYIIQHGLYQDH